MLCYVFVMSIPHMYWCIVVYVDVDVRCGMVVFVVGLLCAFEYMCRWGCVCRLYMCIPLLLVMVSLVIVMLL